MQIGIKLDGTSGTLTPEDRVEQARAAAAAGLAGLWASEPTDADPLTVLAVVGRAVPRIGLGTAIVHTYPRHPLVLAGQALAVQAAVGNRLTLGVSPGTRFLVEEGLGYAFERPGRRMREYLSVLAPLLRGERVSYAGETITAAGAVDVRDVSPPSLLVGALGPVMLRLAGELADGTVTALTGPTALADYVVPTISRSAAGRPAPRVAATVSVSVTADAAAARARISEQYGFLGQIPGYRAMLDREGAAGVGDVAVVGDEAAVERGLRRYADAGATDLIAAPFGSDEERARTVDLLAGLARAGSTPGTHNQGLAHARH